VFVLRDPIEPPPPLTDDELVDEITTMAGHLSAALAQWLAHVAEFDRRQVWASWGCVSCAHWISWRCSLTPKTAREHVRVARRLEELPLVRAAFARGELSYSKVRALTRLEDVQDEATLVRLGLVHTAAQLEKVVRATRRVLREEAANADRDRHLLLMPDVDGSVEVRGRLTAEDAAVLRRALALAGEVVRREAPDDDRTAAQLAADALVLLADSVLVTGPAGRSTADRHEVVVHVDADALTGDERGVRHVEDDTPIAVETARRLCCDAGIVPQLERGGELLAIGRRTRTVPPAIRRALRHRDRGCRFPGCTATRWVDAHHIDHWADGGPTDMGNLVLLCARHHRAMHELGFTVARTTGPPPGGFRGSLPLEFRTPWGAVLDPVSATSGTAGALRDAVAAGGDVPGPTTCVPGWSGEPLDLACSVHAVLGQLGQSSGNSSCSSGDPSASPPTGSASSGNGGDVRCGRGA